MSLVGQEKSRSKKIDETQMRSGGQIPPSKEEVANDLGGSGSPGKSGSLVDLRAIPQPPNGVPRVTLSLPVPEKQL